MKAIVKVIKGKTIKSSGASGTVYVPAIYKGFKANIIIYLDE